MGCNPLLCVAINGNNRHRYENRKRGVKTLEFHMSPQQTATLARSSRKDLGSLRNPWFKFRCDLSGRTDCCSIRHYPEPIVGCTRDDSSLLIELSAVLTSQIDSSPSPQRVRVHPRGASGVQPVRAWCLFSGHDDALQILARQVSDVVLFLGTEILSRNLQSWKAVNLGYVLKRGTSWQQL